jgi:glycosyltransferase EpsD
LDISCEKLRVVYDGVDTRLWSPVSAFKRAEAKRQLGITPSRITVLMIARYARNKRHDLLIEAVAGMSQREAIHIILVGESFESAQCEEDVNELLSGTGLDRQTTKLRFQRDIRAVEAAADICVLCSEAEPLGMSVLEAMAMGIPVIVSEDGGLQELVHGGAGFVVGQDGSGLGEALSILASDPLLRASLGARGRQICIESCDVKRCASSIELIYDSVLGARPV